MRVFKIFFGALALIITAAGFGYQFDRSGGVLLTNTHARDVTATDIGEVPVKPNSSGEPATQRYILNASESKFFAHALAGGLLWFKGHDHLIAVREFSGEAQLTPNSITPASLNITAKSASMVETSSVFTEPQKQIINKELREIVLQPDQYPDIVFKSTNVTGKTTAANVYDLKITGDLTLHGLTRPITIPTQVTVTGNDLRARGEFSINRGDFKVKATSAMHGLIRVKNRVKFTFDIIGHKVN